MTLEFDADLTAIARIDAIPSILEVVCRMTGMGFATVARVTEERWIACSVRDDIAFGLLPGGELEIETTICHEVRQRGEPVVIDHVAEHAIYARHHTPARYGFQSYISMPIMRRDGRFFGTLCAIDPRPARLDNPETIGMFKLFADLIAFHLDSDEKLIATEARLSDAEATAELREQFIAVLGHDLRNPLAAIGAGAGLLLNDPPREKAVTVLRLIQGSVARMGALIDNILDLARSRLGGGIAIERVAVDLHALLAQVVNELQASHPKSTIDVTVDLEGPVQCDALRMAQLVSNLVGNALTHGYPNTPVTIRADRVYGDLRICVVNRGDPIPHDARARLFQPFARGAIQADRQGLGLGLYIASRIALAHGGTLDVSSDSDETCFTFRMPLGESIGAR